MTPCLSGTLKHSRQQSSSSGSTFSSSTLFMTGRDSGFGKKGWVISPLSLLLLLSPSEEKGFTGRRWLITGRRFYASVQAHLTLNFKLSVTRVTEKINNYGECLWRWHGPLDTVVDKILFALNLLFLILGTSPIMQSLSIQLQGGSFFFTTPSDFFFNFACLVYT